MLSAAVAGGSTLMLLLQVVENKTCGQRMQVFLKAQVKHTINEALLHVIHREGVLERLEVLLKPPQVALAVALSLLHSNLLDLHKPVMVGCT